jgi:hypothetical protein
VRVPALLPRWFHLTGRRGVENVFEAELTAAGKAMFERSFQPVEKTDV